MMVRDTEEKWRQLTLRESIDGKTLILEKHYENLRLSPEEARYLARKLYSLARRAEQRQSDTPDA